MGASIERPSLVGRSDRGLIGVMDSDFLRLRTVVGMRVEENLSFGRKVLAAAS
jgi:hypothetical protein